MQEPEVGRCADGEAPWREKEQLPGTVRMVVQGKAQLVFSLTYS